MPDHYWGKAFADLCKAKGVKTKQGARNDKSTSATVAEVAKELGVSERTARRRMKDARDYETLNDVKRSAGGNRRRACDRPVATP